MCTQRERQKERQRDRQKDKESFMFHAFALKAFEVEVCLLNEKRPSMLPFFTEVKHRHALRALLRWM